jgi:hypothetical protein
MCLVHVAQNVFHFKSILRKGDVVIYVSVAIILIVVFCVVNVIQLSSVVSLPIMKDQKLERQGDTALGYDYSVLDSFSLAWYAGSTKTLHL